LHERQYSTFEEEAAAAAGRKGPADVEASEAEEEDDDDASPIGGSSGPEEDDPELVGEKGTSDSDGGIIETASEVADELEEESESAGRTDHEKKLDLQTRNASKQSNGIPDGRSATPS
jgi:hypothetical protein